MKGSEAARILRDAGFTDDELRAVAGLLSFAVTLGEAGEVGPVGDLPELTDEKRAALMAYFEAGRGGFDDE